MKKSEEYLESRAFKMLINFNLNALLIAYN
jgi:hypothetical protein